MAVADESRQLDWSTFEARVAALAGRLRATGVGPGDRVAVLLPNRTALLEILFGTTRVGAIFLPINLRLSPREIAFQLDDSRPSTLFYESDLQDTVDRTLARSRHRPRHVWAVAGDPDPYEEELNSAEGVSKCVQVSPEHPAILMYTSGTTGVPKGALLPHRKSLYNSLNAAEYFANGGGDRVLVVAPLFHSLGLQILAVPMIHAGGTLLLQRQFDPERVWDAVEQERITYLGGVPNMYQRLEDTLAENPPDRWQHEDLRFAFTAGSAVSPELIRAFGARGIRLQQGYGQTETSILTCLSADEAQTRAGSVGRPVSFAEVRVVDRKDNPGDPASWRDTRPTETGEIIVRGHCVMKGYLNNPEATAEAIRGGWFHTGDIGHFDEDGYLFIVDRLKDMIIRGGFNVYPRELEEVLITHPDVSLVAVVGVPDDEYGEEIKAFVVAKPNHQVDGDALIEWSKSRLAAYKYPRQVEVRESLPMNATGKILKKELRG